MNYLRDNKQGASFPTLKYYPYLSKSPETKTEK